MSLYRSLYRSLAIVVALHMSASVSAAELPLSPEKQTFLEGEWHGVTVDTNANKLCTAQSPQATVFTFEFQKTGGLAYFDNGVQEESGRKKIASATEDGALMSLQIEGQLEPWVFRKDGADRLAVVRTSASLGMPVDAMVFKRCRPAADRSKISLSVDALKQISAEMPGDFPFYVDSRIAAKVPNACKAAQVQYLFFGLAGPVEFRISRWNSFDLADALTSGKKSSLPIDPIGDWMVLAAESGEGGLVKLQVRNYDDANAVPVSLTIQPKENGRISIPEWKREYVRCKGFDSRS